MGVDSIISTIEVGRFHYILTAIITLMNSLEFQYRNIPLYVSASLYCNWHLTVAQASLIVSMNFAGNILGTMVIGRMADVYGRRTTIVIGTYMSMYILLLNIFVKHFVWIVVLQFLLGFSCAGKNIVTSYLFEFFPKHYRETSMFVPAIGSSIFSVLMSALAFIIPYTGWRIFLAIFLCVEMVLSITLIWLPESPRYLEVMHQDSEAMAVLQRIGRYNLVRLPSSLDIRPPESEDEDEKKSRPIFLSRRCIWLVVLMTSLVFASSLLYPALFSISLTVREVPRVCLQSPWSVWPPLTSIHTSTACCMIITLSSYIFSIISTSGEVPSLIIWWLITHYIGRIPAIATSFTLISLALSVTLFCPPAVILDICFIVARGITKAMLALLSLYTNEIFPTKIRNTAFGIIYSIGRLGTIAAANEVNTLFIGHSSLLGLGVLVVIAFGAACISCMLPIETRNRSLRDIETYYI